MKLLTLSMMGCYILEVDLKQEKNKGSCNPLPADSFSRYRINVISSDYLLTMQL